MHHKKDRLMTEMSMSTGYLGSLIDIMTKLGWPREEQLRFLQISESFLADPRCRVPIDQATAYFDHAENLLDDPLIGLRVGYNFRVATFVETGSILAYCFSIAEAAKINRRYQPLVETLGRCDLIRADDHAVLRWDPAFSDMNGHRHLTELIFGGYVTTIRWLGWAFGSNVQGVTFMHAAAAPIENYEKILDCPIAFEHSQNGVKIPEDVVDRELPTYNPQRLHEAKMRMDRFLLGRETQSELISRVRAAIRAALDQSHLNFAKVAEILNMKERQLRNELAAEGVLFRDVTDDVRKDMFHALFREQRSLSEIAQVLGYSDQSAFNRAFHRWYQMRPGDYSGSRIRL